MCGITGVFAFNLVGKFNMIHVTAATMALHQRGPDFQDIYIDEYIGLGHRRLSIIDTRSIAHQPMWDLTKKYCIVFNGEIFNYRELRTELEALGVNFITASDTEVLLNMFIHFGEACLNRLNGFFAFCIYNKEDQSFFVARDRYGIKPLLYLFDEDKFLFASEMKSILEYGIDKELDYTSLFTYLQLNYIPAPETIFTHVKKLMPGHYLNVSRKKLEVHRYYTIPVTPDSSPLPYPEAKEKLKTLLEESVQRRLVADVPLGAFLSGGIDSSVITALASKHKPDLHTFSIGFRDEKFFDETSYRDLVDYLNRLNADWIRAMKRVSPNTLIELLEVTQQPVIDYLHSLDLLATAPFAVSWAGENESQNWFHIAREYTERWHHQQQIREAVEKQEIMDKEFFSPLIQTFMMALPYTYRDTEAPDGSMISVIVGHPSNQEWKITSNQHHWSFSESLKTPDTVIEMSGDTAWKLFTKALPETIVPEKIKISGNTALGKPILKMLSVMA